MREVKQSLRKATVNEERRSLTEKRVAAFLDWLDAIQTDDDEVSSVPRPITKADGHVFHAAQRHSATVLTSDASLWLGLRECNVPSLLPLEWIRQLDEVTLVTTTFGAPPTAAAGSLFVRVYPGAWARGMPGKFRVACFPSGFWWYFDATRSCWVEEVADLANPLLCKEQIQASTLQTVCLSWDVAAAKPKIELRVAGVALPVEQPLGKPLDFRPSDYPSLGSLCGANHFWNGQICFRVSNDRPVGKDSWKSYLHHRHLAPNPYDADRVAAALTAL